MIKIKKFLRIIFMLGIFGLTYSFFYSSYENIKVNKMINNFKSRAIYEEGKDIVFTGPTTYTRKYMKVPRETSNELNDNNNVFNDDEQLQLGINGDIYATRKSPFKGVPFIHQFITYYYGGHSAILKYENDVEFFIEATGFPEPGESILDYIFTKYDQENNLTSITSKKRGNYWLNPTYAYEAEYYNYFYRDKYIGLRPVNHFTSFDNSNELYNNYIDAAILSAEEKVASDSLYNFLFFLNMRGKYYCTDLMSRAYEEAYEKVMNNDENFESKGYGKVMNDDGFITSVNDLILSNDTFIHFYVEIKEEKINGEKELIEYIYYLEHIEV